MWLRAERLAMLYLMEGEEPELDGNEIIGHGLFKPSQYELAVVHGITYDDYSLFCALREVEVEKRARQYDALERLAVLLTGDTGSDARAQWGAAIDRNTDAVTECMEELGWISGDDAD